MKVGVRELRNRLSFYLGRVKAGEYISVTDRGEEIAVLTPANESEERRRMMRLVEAGIISWNGQKPVFGEPVQVPGKPLSEIIVEDRD